MIKKYLENGKTLFKVQVFVKDRNRKQRSNTRSGITTEKEAKRLEFEFRHELMSEIEQECEWTWEKWHEEAIRKMRLSLSPSTILQYDGRLKKWIPDEWDKRLLVTFCDSDIHSVINREETNVLSSKSRQTVLKLISRVFEMAVEEGVIARNPAHGLRIKVQVKEQLVLTASEAQTLLQAAQNYAHKFYPVWAFALMSGMRSGEMFALRWTDVDLESGNIHVTKQWTSKSGITAPKNGKGRIVPISTAFAQFLKAEKVRTGGHSRTLSDFRLKSKVSFDDYVLPSLGDWATGLQAHVLKEFCRQIGIKTIKFHDLRATFITNLLANGVPLVQVMAIVGHAKMSTTDVYLRLAGVNVKGATDKLGYELPDLAIDGKILEFKR